MSNGAALTRKYGLEPLSESVVRLGKLVMKRDADMDEIVKVISTDQALKAQLLRAASPADGHLTVDTVEQAIFRTGIGCVLALAMSDPLVKAVGRTFHTMVGVQLEPADPVSMGPLVGTYFLGSADFSGRATGSVHLRLQDDFGRYITAQVLMTGEGDEITEGVNDVLGELVNMVVGNFKSNLNDAGLTCKLSLPRVTKTAEFSVPRVASGRHQVFGFKYQNNKVLVDIVVTSTD